MPESDVPRASVAENPIHRSLVWTAWMLLTHFVAGVLLLWAMISVVPRFIAMFAEFEAEVPPVTELLIVVSNLVARWGYLLLPLGLAVDAVLLLALSRLPAGARWLGTLWATLVLVAALVAFALMIVAIMLPLAVLIESLS